LAALSSFFIRGTRMAKKSRRKIDPLSRDPEILGESIRQILQSKNLMTPLEAHFVLNAIERLPFSFHHFWDKIRGLWITTNMHFDIYEGREIFSGTSILASDLTFEMSAARAIHYFYHYELNKEKNLIQGEVHS